MNRFTELLAVFESDIASQGLSVTGKRRETIIEALRIAAAGVLPDIPNASTIERKIVGRLVTDLLAAGFSLSVNDGEEITVQKSTDADAIYAALSSTDQDYLYVHRPNDKREPWIRLVWGNDCCVISDYLTSLDTWVDPVQQFATELEDGQ